MAEDRASLIYTKMKITSNTHLSNAHENYSVPLFLISQIKFFMEIFFSLFLKIKSKIKFFFTHKKLKKI